MSHDISEWRNIIQVANPNIVGTRFDGDDGHDDDQSAPQ